MERTCWIHKGATWTGLKDELGGRQVENPSKIDWASTKDAMFFGHRFWIVFFDDLGTIGAAKNDPKPIENEVVFEDEKGRGKQR